MKLSQLHTLVAVADHHNFSEAALRLEVSQSAVSHAIAALEEELGVVLVVRGRHGARLTPVGEQIASYARQVLQLEQEIQKTANQAKGLQGGQVRITSFRSVATHILPKIILEFRMQFPAIAISITERSDYADVEQDLRDGRADVGFTVLPTSADMSVWELLRDQYIVLLPPDRVLPEPPTWDDLENLALIMAPESRSCCSHIAAHYGRLKEPLNVVYEVREDSTTVNMVAQGLGATIMPRLAAEPIPSNVPIWNLPEPLFRTICVVVLSEALLVPPVYAFLDRVKGMVGDINKRG